MKITKALGAVAAGFFFLSSLSLAGCAAEDVDGDDTTQEGPTDEVAGETSESDLTITPTRQAQLDALRARVTQDFKNVASLKDMKLVFVVQRYKSNASKCVLFGHIMKRDKAGKDHELTSADYKGSYYEEAIKEGFFDGPEVMSILKNVNGKWQIAKKGDSEAYVVGPTDVAYWPWPEEFGVPRAWLGLPPS
jgi:hypothetical protein